MQIKIFYRHTIILVISVFYLVSCAKKKEQSEYSNCSVTSYSDTMYITSGGRIPGAAKFNNSVIHIYGTTSGCYSYNIHTNDTTIGTHKLGDKASNIYFEYIWPAIPSVNSGSGSTITTASDTGTLVLTKVNHSAKTISGNFQWRTYSGSFSNIHW